MRRVIAFPCEGETLAGTLDAAPGTTGLLIVSGGNEVRVGAHRGMALLAHRLAEQDVPVFRFDRRGIGDSTGENRGYDASGPDIVAAAAAFRKEQPQLERVIGFGNCDAATALALFHHPAGLTGLVLANPWLGDQPDDLPAPAAIRAHYARRLTDPAAWRALLGGRIDIAKLFSGLRKTVVGKPENTATLATALADTPATRIVLATSDNTAIAFATAWKRACFAPVRERIAIERIDTDSHSFARPGDAAALEAAIMKTLIVDLPTRSG